MAAVLMAQAATREHLGCSLSNHNTIQRNELPTEKTKKEHPVVSERFHNSVTFAICHASSETWRQVAYKIPQVIMELLAASARARRCEFHYDPSKATWYRVVMAPLSKDDDELRLHYINENAMTEMPIEEGLEERLRPPTTEWSKKDEKRATQLVSMLEGAGGNPASPGAAGDEDDDKDDEPRQKKQRTSGAKK